jgi:hypothetical protein
LPVALGFVFVLGDFVGDREHRHRSGAQVPLCLYRGCAHHAHMNLLTQFEVRLNVRLERCLQHGPGK